MTDADRIADNVLQVDDLVVGPAMVRSWREEIAELGAKLAAAEKLAGSRLLDNKECWHYKTMWEKAADERDELKAKLARYESAERELPKQPFPKGRFIAVELYDRLRDAAVAMKARYESALDDALRKSQAYTEAIERAETAEAALATARQEERERCAKVCEELKFCHLGPTKEVKYQRDLCAKAIRSLTDEEPK